MRFIGSATEVVQFGASFVSYLCALDVCSVFRISQDPNVDHKTVMAPSANDVFDELCLGTLGIERCDDGDRFRLHCIARILI
jgi:hypothetical protein